MKIYICAPHEKRGQHAWLTKVYEECSALGVEVVDSTYKAKGETATPFPMKVVDGFILCACCPQQEIVYILAFAALQKKPVLFLEQQPEHKRLLRQCLGVRVLPPFVYECDVQEKKLAQHVRDFIARDISHQEEYAQAHSIKFTLRVSPKIERYLEWKGKLRKQSKADILRDETERMIALDKEYQRYLAGST